MDNMQNGQRGSVLDCTKNPEHISCRGMSSEPKFRNHDGGSYEASRVVNNPMLGPIRVNRDGIPLINTVSPRNVIGHAPGTKGIDNLSAAADEGRTLDVWESPTDKIAEAIFGGQDRGRYRSLPPSETGAGYSTPSSGDVRLNAGALELSNDDRDNLLREIWELPAGASVEGITLSEPVLVHPNVTAATHKPVHGGYPTPIETLMTITPSGAALIAKEIVDVGGPRANGFNYGGGNTTLPSVYFDGVRMETTINRMLQEMSARAWKLTTAVRNVRLAETPTEKLTAEWELRETMQATLSEFPHLKVAIMVDDIIATIDAKLPEPNGYTNMMGLHYFMHPIRKALKTLQSFIRQSV